MRGRRLGPSFSLRPSCPRLFNIFARNDPVAYRLEPLLVDFGDADEDSGQAGADAVEGNGGGEGGKGDGWGKVRKMVDEQPRYVPAFGKSSGMKLHIKLRQDLQGVVQQAQQAQQAASAAGKSVQKSLLQAQQALTNPKESAKLAVAHSFKGVASLFGKSEEGAASADDAGRGSAAEEDEGFVANGGERVDWQLQESHIEAAMEYTAALQAHTSYFGSQDLAAFIVNEVVLAG